MTGPKRKTDGPLAAHADEGAAGNLVSDKLVPFAADFVFASRGVGGAHGPAAARADNCAACNLLCVPFSGSMSAFWGVDAELLDTQQCILMDMVAAVLTATEQCEFRQASCPWGPPAMALSSRSDTDW